MHAGINRKKKQDYGYICIIFTKTLPLYNSGYIENPTSNYNAWTMETSQTNETILESKSTHRHHQINSQYANVASLTFDLLSMGRSWIEANISVPTGVLFPWHRYISVQGLICLLMLF